MESKDILVNDFKCQLEQLLALAKQQPNPSFGAYASNLCMLLEDIVLHLDSYTKLIAQKLEIIKAVSNIVLKKRMIESLENEVKSYIRQIELLVYEYNKIFTGVNNASQEMAAILRNIELDVIEKISQKLFSMVDIAKN